MDPRRSFLHPVVVALVVIVPLIGLSGIAQATRSHKHHPGGASGGLGSNPSISVKVSPNPLVETGRFLAGVVEVEANPSFAGDSVFITSPQLTSSCGSTAEFVTLQGGNPASQVVSSNGISVILDDDGNATIAVQALGCAPGLNVVEASLTAAPFDTALTTLQISPPIVTPTGVAGFPNPEVETGNTAASGSSDVYAVFYVETNPVYAEQAVEIGSAQLEASCGGGWYWAGGNGGTVSEMVPGGVNTGPEATTYLDDDGNAVFGFLGSSCAAGTWQVIADVLAGTHQTYTTTYIVSPPEPTI